MSSTFVIVLIFVVGKIAPLFYLFITTITNHQPSSKRSVNRRMFSYTFICACCLLLVCLPGQPERRLLADHRRHAHSRARPFSSASPRNSGYYLFVSNQHWLAGGGWRVCVSTSYPCLYFPSSPILYFKTTAPSVRSADQITEVFPTYLTLETSNHLRDTRLYLSTLRDKNGLWCLPPSALHT